MDTSGFFYIMIEIEFPDMLRIDVFVLDTSISSDQSVLQ
jgi:hypothetical protein